jgi:polyisoprenoid-binding protein YceI
MNTTKTLWKIDPYHSDIEFKVKHLVISTVTGSFNSFDATVETDEDDLEGAEIHFAADTDSITTGVKQRDEHLRSDDFFNAEKFPKLTFESTSFTQKGDNEYELKGDLTIRDVTKPVILNVVHGGTIVDQNGDTKAGFEVSGKINRKDFGLKWNGVTETGNVIVSDEVKLNLSVQFAQN